MITLKEIVKFTMYSPEKVKAFYIDEQGLDYQIDPYMGSFYIAEGVKTLKIEGLENLLTEYKPRTVHCFISKAGAPSFPEHTDTCDVTIHCVSGIKTMEVNGVEHIIHEGKEIHIPEGTPHRATNRYDSIILSIGD